MNRYFFTLLLACISLAASSQYVPMPLNKGQWRYRTTSSYDQNVVVLDYMLLGSNSDTVIAGKTYKKIFQRECTRTGFKPFGATIESVVATAPDQPGFLLRESGQKVYWYRSGSSGPAADTLIYDFTLDVADTIPTVFNHYPGGTPPVYVIKVIDMVEANGSQRRRFKATNTSDNMDTIMVIEGIGSNRGLIMNNRSGIYGQYELDLQFHCYTDPTVAYTPNGMPCTYIWSNSTPVSVKTNKRLGVDVYPNPFTEVLSIETPDAATLTIYNSTSAVVMRRNLAAGQTTVATGTYPSGIYFISLQDQKGTAIYTGKLLKQ